VSIYGRLYCAFNNAGIRKELIPTTDFAGPDWNQVIDINLKSVWLCMMYEIPEMLKIRKGAIVSTSSAAGLVAILSNPAYPASKHGVVGLTKTTGLEFVRRGIRVDAVCPGLTRTGMHESLVAVPPDTVEKDPYGQTRRARRGCERGRLALLRRSVLHYGSRLTGRRRRRGLKSSRALDRSNRTDQSDQRIE
jgi:NAD(P)-dependent dehydrogenase (short-subunit alcohol dehydrogenase family)